MDKCTSQLKKLRATIWTTLAVVLTSCGGGGGNDPTIEAPINPPVKPLPTELSISWASDLSGPQSRAVPLAVMVPINAAGIKQVDFFADGVLFATVTTGAKQPGFSLLQFSTAWNSASYSDGAHSLLARVTDNANATAETPTRIVTLANNVTIPVTLSPNQIFPAPPTAAMGAGEFRINLATGAIAGEYTLTNMTASSMHLHVGWPTISGSNILALTFDSAANQWIVPPNATLTTFGSDSQVNEVVQGRLYLDAHSTSYPEGEIRGQVLTDSMSLAFSPLSGDRESPPVSSQGTGTVAVLENRATQRYQVTARTSGLTGVTALGVYSSSGPATFANWLFYLRVDDNGDVVASGDLRTPGYNTGTWFMNVLTASHPSGEIGGYLPVIQPR